MFGGSQPRKKNLYCVRSGRQNRLVLGGQPGSSNFRTRSYYEFSPSLFLDHQTKISSRASVNPFCLQFTSSLHSTAPPTSLEMPYVNWLVFSSIQQDLNSARITTVATLQFQAIQQLY